MRGHIKKRAKGSWTVYLYAGFDPETGRKKYRTQTVRGTKKQAEAVLAQLIHAIETGTDFDSARLSVADFLDRWLEVKRKKVKPRTFTRYEELVRLHVTPVVGKLPLAKLKPLHIERVYVTAVENGLSQTTVCRIHRVMFMALKQAVRWQLVPRNAAEAVVPPRPDKQEVQALEVRDALRLIESLGDEDLRLMAVIGLGTGLRLGECLGLRWRDIDLDAGLFRVVQQLQTTGAFDPPKSHRSSRTVSLPAFVVDALRIYRKAQSERRLLCGPGWVDLDLVFERGDGSSVRSDTASKRFKRAAREAGFDITFHGLRHGHASLMLASGVDLKVASQRLGHSSISITADLYTHVASKLDKQAADSLNTLFGTRD